MAMKSWPAVLADLVDLAHVRVVDAGRGARLAPEALAGRLVGLGDRLDRDRAAEALVLGREDDAHAALPEPVEDAVAAEPLRVAARRGRGVVPRRPSTRRRSSPFAGRALGKVRRGVRRLVLGHRGCGCARVYSAPMKTALFVGLFLVAIPYLVALGRAVARGRAAGATGEDSPAPTPLGLAIGFVTNFFDTLGIGSFAPTTAIFKFTGLVRDERIPGTLNVGHTAPTLVEAFIFIAIVNVDIWTLVLMIAAAVAGSWFGAGVVSGWPRRNIQIGMGLARCSSRPRCSCSRSSSIAPGEGDALVADGRRLAIGVAVNFLLGRPDGGGRGAVRPVHDPRGAARHEPHGGVPDHDGLVRVPDADRQPEVHPQRRYSLRASLGLGIGGVPAVLIAATSSKSMPL